MEKPSSHTQESNIEITEINDQLHAVLDLAEDKIAEIEHEVQNLSDKQKSVLRRYRDAIFYYTRFVILGGLVLAAPGDRPTQGSENPEEIKARAQQELVLSGITREQRQTYKPIISELLERTVDPMETYKTGAKDFFQNLVHGRGNELWKNIGHKTEHEEDAWRLYLGMPQEHDTFEISEYAPSKSVGDTPYYYKLKGFLEHPERLMAGEYSTIDNAQDAIKYIVTQIDRRGGRFIDMQGPGEPMGNFTWTRGEDENGSYIAYYDKWDLDIPIEQDGFFGKPYEIYDRLYYNPQTFDPVSQ